MFFEVWWQDKAGIVGVADANPPDDSLRTLKRCRRYGGLVSAWEPWEHRLLNGGFFDYQPETSGLRLCSEKLKAVIEAHRSPTDDIQWLQTSVTNESGEQRPYWILHFPHPPDVVNETKLRGGAAVNRVLDLQRAQGYNFLPALDGVLNTFLTSDIGRSAIEEAGCTGVLFQGVESE